MTTARADPPQTSVDTNTAPWYEHNGIEGARTQALHTDSTGRYSLVLVLPPHTRYPDHSHGSYEWCYVLAGSIADSQGAKAAGTFFYNAEGSKHRDIASGPEGCTLFVVKGKGTNTPLGPRDACCS